MILTLSISILEFKFQPGTLFPFKLSALSISILEFKLKWTFKAPSILFPLSISILEFKYRKAEIAVLTGKSFKY